MIRGLGYKKDLPDPRDRVFSAARRGELPSVGSLEDAVVQVLQQGSLGSCVAAAGFQAIRTRQTVQACRKMFPDHSLASAVAKLRVRGKLPPLGSRLMGYYLARKVDHTEAFDAGTHPRSFFRAIQHFGFADERKWPYSDDDTNSKEDRFRMEPPSSVLHSAYDMRSPVRYERIASGNGAYARVKAAICAGFPVVFGVDVDEKFCDGDFDKDSPVAPPKESVGGHAMCFVGFDDRLGARVVNSWGREWADRGFCWLSREYVEQADDLWVVEHAPTQGEV